MTAKQLFRKLRLRASYYYCPPERLALRQVSLRDTPVGQVDLLVPRNEDVGRLIYYLREYEPDYMRYLIRNLQRNDICIDVGANLGYYTVFLAKAVTDGRVYAFEPDPFSYALLQLNVQMNQLKNVVLNRIALGDRPGLSRFVRCSDSAFNSFRDTARRSVSQTIEVPVTTLDEFVITNRVPKVDFMKVDVEGAEGMVLAGARGVLEDAEQRPRLLLVEVVEANHKTFGDSAEGILNSLRRAHYDPFLPSGENPRACAPDKLFNVFFALQKAGHNGCAPAVA